MDGKSFGTIHVEIPPLIQTFTFLYTEYIYNYQVVCTFLHFFIINRFRYYFIILYTQKHVSNQSAQFNPQRDNRAWYSLKFMFSQRIFNYNCHERRFFHIIYFVDIISAKSKLRVGNCFDPVAQGIQKHRGSSSTGDPVAQGIQ